MMAAEQPLGELLTAETYALLEQTAQKCGISMDRLNAFRPWAVTSALSSQAAAADIADKDILLIPNGSTVVPYPKA